MTLYTLALCFHVVTAVVGLGQVVAIARLAAASRGSAPLPTVALMTLRRLMRGAAAALALILLSGALIEYAGGARFHQTWWFRLSFLQVLVLGALNGMGLTALRRIDEASLAIALRRISITAWVMIALIADTTILMELKPW
jgi:hypothetical protein